jgi:NAD(P)-dependent dehydrogenase (short-subunit alcohol dehydrogenase family)
METNHTDRTIILTGASDGIGKAAARALAKDNEVIIIGHNPEKTRQVAQELHAAHHVADFMQLDDVRALADKLGQLQKIDILANNAGGVQGPRRLRRQPHGPCEAG